MIRAAAARWEEVIEEALSASTAKVTRAAGGGWSVSMKKGKRASVSVRMDDCWLVMREVLGAAGRRGAEDLWEMLEWNTGLVEVRFGLQGDGRLCLRSDVPLDLETDVAECVRKACAAFHAVGKQLNRGQKRCSTGSAGAAEDGNGMAVDVERLCEEAGWAFVERKGGRLAVQLDVPGEFRQAIVETRDGCVTLWTELGAWQGDALPAACRCAVAALLLRACDVVRLARATAEAANDRASVGFGVAFSGAPTCTAVAHGFSALSVACRLCGKEVMALKDVAVAEQYLSLQGWPS